MAGRPERKGPRYENAFTLAIRRATGDYASPAPTVRA